METAGALVVLTKGAIWFHALHSSSRWHPQMLYTVPFTHSAHLLRVYWLSWVVKLYRTANIPICVTSSARRTLDSMVSSVHWVRQLHTGCEQEYKDKTNSFQHPHQTICDMLRCMYFLGTGLVVQMTTCCISRIWNRASFRHMLTPPVLSPAAHHSASYHPLGCLIRNQCPRPLG